MSDLDLKLIAARNWRWVGFWHPPMSLPCVGETGIDSCHTEESIGYALRQFGGRYVPEAAETCPHCGHIRARRDQIYRSNEPKKIVATYDMNEPVTIDHRIVKTLADRSSYMEHVMQHTWKERDRVRVLTGEHGGRTGTVVMLPTHPHARFFAIDDNAVLVALDGEPGEVAKGPGAVARGGRGGFSIPIANDNLESYNGPAGVVLGKDRR